MLPLAAVTWNIGQRPRSGMLKGVADVRGLRSSSGAMNSDSMSMTGSSWQSRLRGPTQGCQVTRA